MAKTRYIYIYIWQVSDSFTSEITSYKYNERELIHSSKKNIAHIAMTSMRSILPILAKLLKSFG